MNLHVQPRARAPGIDGLHGGRLRVRLAAPPTAGKANEELLALLARDFALPRRAVTLLHGAGAQMKTVELLAPRALPAWFSALGGQPCPAGAPSLDSRPRRSPAI